jgi:lipopolysaccharide transport protein LptA
MTGAIPGALAVAVLALFPLMTARAEPAGQDLVIALAAPVGTGAEPAGRYVARLSERICVDSGCRVVAGGAALKGFGPESSARSVRKAAFGLGADALLLSRAEAAQGGRGIAARPAVLTLVLRSGHSGGVLGRYEEALYEGGEAGAADPTRLAASIRSDLGVAAAPAASAAAAAAGSGPSAADETPSGLFGLAEGESGGPISIDADELEFFAQPDESRRLVFRKNVRVVQGDVTLQADELEAYYPPEDSRPERLEARGNVRVQQGDRHARCEVARYLAATRILTCSGRAELIYGCDEVRGDSIEFDLAHDRARVVGAASVLIHPGARNSGVDCKGKAR